MPPVTRAQITNAEFELDRLKVRYLERFGWRRTCQTPGSYWLWEREFEGRSFVVPLDHAVSMTERALDEDEPADDDE